MKQENRWLNIALGAPPQNLSDTLREQLTAAASENFAVPQLPEPTQTAAWPNPPPPSRADQLKAWLAEHWLAMEEPLVLLLPGDDIEPGVLNLAMPVGDEVFIGVASLKKFIEALEKLTGQPAESIFQQAVEQNSAVWISG